MPRIQRHEAMAVVCPKCGAQTGDPCVRTGSDGEPRKSVHQERYKATKAFFAKPRTILKVKVRLSKSTRTANREWAITRAKVFALHGAQCVYCGADASHVDHKTPLSRGGTDAIDNLVPACMRCNIRKGVMTFEEFTA